MPFTPGEPKSGGRQLDTRTDLRGRFGKQYGSSTRALADIRPSWNGHGKTRLSITGLPHR
jgi:hypothetical protein